MKQQKGNKVREEIFGKMIHESIFVKAIRVHKTIIKEDEKKYARFT